MVETKNNLEEKNLVDKFSNSDYENAKGDPLLEEAGEELKGKKKIDNNRKVPHYQAINEEDYQKRLKAHNDSSILYNNAIDLQKRLSSKYTFDTDSKFIGEDRSFRNRLLNLGFEDEEDRESYFKESLTDDYHGYHSSINRMDDYPDVYDTKNIEGDLFKIKDTNALINYQDDRSQFLHRKIEPRGIITGISNNSVDIKNINRNAYFDPNIDYNKANDLLELEIGERPFSNEEEFDRFKKTGDDTIGRISNLFKDKNESVWDDTYSFWDYTNVKPLQEVLPPENKQDNKNKTTTFTNEDMSPYIAHRKIGVLKNEIPIINQILSIEGKQQQMEAPQTDTFLFEKPWMDDSQRYYISENGKERRIQPNEYIKYKNKYPIIQNGHQTNKGISSPRPNKWTEGLEELD